MTTPERAPVHFLLRGRAWERAQRALEAAGYAAAEEGAASARVAFLDTADGRLGRRGVRLLLWRQAGGWRLRWRDPSGRQEDLCRREGPPPAGPVVDGGALGLGDRASLWGGKPLIWHLEGRVRVRSYLLSTPSGRTLRLEREDFVPPGSRRVLSLLRAWAPGREEASSLDHLEVLLRDRAALPPAGGDLAALAYGAAGRPDPSAPSLGDGPLTMEMPLALAARRLLCRQVSRMEAFLPWALRDLHPEFVHDARVAARRARTLLRLVGPALGPRRAQSLRLELRWVAGLLGKVRDLDVFLDGLGWYVRELPPGVLPPRTVLERLAEDRREALQDLREGLSGRRLARLLERLRRLVLSPPPKRPRGPGALGTGDAARRLLRRQVRRALRAADSLGPAPPPEALHRLRILFKRVRYALEFFRELLPEEAQECIEEATALQEVLGAHQDAVVAVRRLQEAVERAAPPPEELLASGVLLQRFWQSAEVARGDLEKGLRRFRRSWRRLRRHLGEPAGETSAPSLP